MAISSTKTLSEIIAAGGGGASLEVRDEGVVLTTAAGSINFVGSSVSVSESNGDVTVTITGTGGSNTDLAIANRDLDSLDITSSTGTNVTIESSTISLAGLQSAADKTKLDSIESNATADQTGAEIKTAYEGEADTNAFTDAEKTKLAAIEPSATTDQNASEVPFTATGNTTSTDVQSAIVELQTELDGVSSGGGSLGFDLVLDYAKDVNQSYTASADISYTKAIVSNPNFNNIEYTSPKSQTVLVKSISRIQNGASESRFVVRLNLDTGSGYVAYDEKEESVNANHLSTLEFNTILDLNVGDKVKLTVESPASGDLFGTTLSDLIYFRVYEVVNTGGSTSSSESEKVNYTTQDETVIPNKYFETSSGMYKPMYRKIIQVPSGPNNATVNINHNITPTDIEPLSLSLKGLANDGQIYRPLPYTGSGTTFISLLMNGTVVQLFATADYSAYSCRIDIEYAKVSDTQISL